MPSLNRFKRSDVRPLLRRGCEPCPVIRKRAGALNLDEGLIVIAPFLPSPLTEKLGREGFASEVASGQCGDWVVYFWREGG